MCTVLTCARVVGPPLIEGRGVFVVFWSFCIGFYSISRVCRRAYGPFFNLFFSHFSVFLLRSELSSQSFTRSWCYVVNFLLRTLHALDATLWTFVWEVLHALDATLWTFVWGGFWGGGLFFFFWGGGLITFCRLRCSWRRSVDATLWTFFLEVYTLLMLRCELLSVFFFVFFFFLGGGLITFCRLRCSWRRSVDATLWTFFLEVYTLLMLRCELLSVFFFVFFFFLGGGSDNVLSLVFLLTSFCWCYVVNFLLGSFTRSWKWTIQIYIPNMV